MVDDGCSVRGSSGSCTRATFPPVVHRMGRVPRRFRCRGEISYSAAYLIRRRPGRVAIVFVDVAGQRPVPQVPARGRLGALCSFGNDRDGHGLAVLVQIGPDPFGGGAYRGASSVCSFTNRRSSAAHCGCSSAKAASAASVSRRTSAAPCTATMRARAPCPANPSSSCSTT